MSVLAFASPNEIKEAKRERKVVRANPRGGVKIDKSRPCIHVFHPFETTGSYRLHVNGVPGPWLRGPADRGE